MIDLTTLSAPLALPCGDVSLRNRIALAPMAGWTDVPFRRLAWRYGAGHLVSEMLSSKPELWDTGKSSQRRVLIQGVRPQAVQIAGSDPKIMAGGISQALVTTVLGLVVAIPTTLAHSFLQSSARSVVDVLEEQATGIVAEKAK